MSNPDQQHDKRRISVSSSSGIVSIPSSVTDMFVCEIMSENGNSHTSDNDAVQLVSA